VPRLLQVLPFGEELFDVVKTFGCGAEPWEAEVADWIKRRNGALRQVSRGRCLVWLYFTDEDDLVGYGSLGPHDWVWPDLNSPPRTTHHIPYMGVDARYQREPSDEPPEWRYSSQIIRHLLGQAIREADENPSRERILGLYVHPANTRAIRFYERVGFQPYEKRFRDPHTNIEYLAMFRRL